MTDPLRILHLSDTHLYGDGRLHYGIVDTVAALDRVLVRAGELEAVDLVVASGDLSDDGSAASYRLLRDRLGFDGVVISDDLSKAAQVLAWSPADRAVLAIQAGVDIVLVSTDPSVIGPMVEAVVAKARSDPAFAAMVDAAARRVVELKRELLG